jgi:CRISPR-associated endonuclease Cas1
MVDRTYSGEFQRNEFEWAERSEYWRNYHPTAPGRNKKYKYREPLILCGHGIRIRVDHNTLLIRNGFTHYPQKSEEIRFFPGDANLPDRVMILDGSGGLSFDSLNWMSEQGISIIRLDFRGRPSFVGGPSGQFAKSENVRWQLSVKGSEKASQINRKLIQAKFAASIETISAIFPGLPTTKLAITRIRQVSATLQKLPISAPQISLLGLEGAAAAEYFRAWHKTPLNWKVLNRKPIPETWLEIGSRQMAWRRDANYARHPINAMLNYGYAVAISNVRSAIIAAGFDPSIGFAHQRKRNPIPLVYDLMEPLRPVVDRKILEFALSHTFTPGDFTINKLGGCRLNPQLAMVVASRIASMGAERVVNGFLKQLP